MWSLRPPAPGRRPRRGPRRPARGNPSPALDDADLGSRRITIAGRTHPLDDLTRQLILAWLGHRRHRWPNTANPHLIINMNTALETDPARTMPHPLRSLKPTDEITAELPVLVGFDQDIAAEAPCTSNRIRGLLTQFHPSLERVLGPRLDHPAVTWHERAGHRRSRTVSLLPR